MYQMGPQQGQESLPEVQWQQVQVVCEKGPLPQVGQEIWKQEAPVPQAGQAKMKKGTCKCVRGRKLCRLANGKVRFKKGGCGAKRTVRRRRRRR